jgi:hypothetical protein
MTSLNRLTKWYASQCNGDWEHRYGVKIETLDNPGWLVEIDLLGTKGENKSVDRTKLEKTENDWIQYWVENRKFHAACGPGNLSEVIDIFCDWFDVLA